MAKKKYVSIDEPEHTLMQWIMSHNPPANNATQNSPADAENSAPTSADTPTPPATGQDADGEVKTAKSD